MANNRELSQLGSIVNIDDSNKSLGIGASVGIGTTVPHYQLDVNGDVNFSGDLYNNGDLFVTGIGIGSDGINSCLLYTSPSPRDYAASRMPSSA